MKKYLVALDQGTTSSRAVVTDLSGHILAISGLEHRQIYPQPGWVEHDPAQILSTQVEALRTAVGQAGIRPEDIAAVGITNQRETTLLWDRETGEPVYNAIVWQCRRTAPLVERLIADGLSDHIRRTTGLIPDAYFSGTKLAWLLDLPGVRARAEAGRLCFGTVDSFLAWHLCEGHPHVTDATNAGRTMLFDIARQQWDETMLRALDIPGCVLPRVIDTAQVAGMLDPSVLGCRIPVAALVGDQHASLFGQGCFRAGEAKITYGTGCFALMNTGDRIVPSRSGLVSTVAWRLNGETSYALEGSVFIGGAVIQWLRDELGMLKTAAESEPVAASVPDSGGVYLVPAFTGLGAPHWDMYSRGTIVGLTRGSSRAHIVRAALESIAYQNADLLDAMTADSGSRPGALRADGGACANNLLMQFQADLLRVPVERPAVIETTACGAAFLAGLAVGELSLEDIRNARENERVFVPLMEEEHAARLRADWTRAVERSKNWAQA